MCVLLENKILKIKTQSDEK